MCFLHLNNSNVTYTINNSIKFYMNINNSINMIINNSIRNSVKQTIIIKNIDIIYIIRKLNKGKKRVKIIIKDNMLK